jgi:type VI secretion system protein ImpI
MMLEVTIKAPAGGAGGTAVNNDRTLRFSQSPIRIGRNQLNDISLQDPFVSEWHGIIRFDERSIAYFDLGSTNGTVLDGKRLPKNVATEISNSSRLQLGLIELRVSQVAAPAVVAGQPRKSMQSGPHKTMAWGYTPPAPGSGGPVAPVDPSGGIETDLGMTPPPLGQRSAMGGVAGPIIGGESGRVGLAAPAAAPRPGGEGALLARQSKLLEAFSEAFIGLRKGYEQFGAEVGVRTINGATPLHRARTRSEVMDYLLQPGVDPEVAARDLIAIFADFGIHHIAMMEGVTESVRILLQGLDPRANDLEDAAPRLFSGAKVKNQWKGFLEKFDQVLTDDNELHASVFGDGFARAYASVTMGDDGKPAPGKDE